jgi:hypothetical protein
LSLRAPSRATGKLYWRPRKKKSFGVLVFEGDLFDLVVEGEGLLHLLGQASRAWMNWRPRLAASMRMRPMSRASRARTVTWAVKALVEATPISGPAWR